MSNSNRGFMSERRQRFGDWRARRPFLGGSLLLLGSVFMAYVAISYGKDLILVGSSTAFLGLVSSSLVFLTGVFALTKPEFSTMIGYVGGALSIISLMGTLGGLFIGMLLGLIGSNLCIAWESDEVEETNPFDWGPNADSDESDDDGVSGLVSKWR
ncbi:DUF6114 domain-containing protein [Halocatena marina]|nr:DUF6114 domain-containing protein [Halocatena marina]